MISFVCPGCQATFKLPDELAGKSARCSKCSERFTVPAGAPAASKKVELNPEPEVMEVEVIEEPAAAPPRAARAKAIDEVEVVEEAIQEPRRGRRAPDRVASDDDDRSSRRRENDWDDDSERPRRKRRRRQASSLGWILAAVGGGVLLLVILIAVIIWAVSRPAVVAVNAGGGPRQAVLINGLFQTQDRISVTDPADPRRPGFHAKRYVVQLEAGKSYAIEMDDLGAGVFGFDPYLRVESQQGNFILEDDDSGVGELDARIVFMAPQAGDYVVSATTFAPRMQGSYRLTIRTPP
jgi:hypothetical protein